MPQELIAQTPLKQRDNSRLLVVNRNTQQLTHKYFYDIADLLNEGDLLLLNSSKVLPARLIGRKKGSPTEVELLLLEQKEHDVWETIVRPGKKLKLGAKIEFDRLTAEITEVLPDGNRLVKFYFEGNFFDILNEVGQMPLPHYITEKLTDKDRYQTVYSKELGSAAAPTAGLHFTPELLQKLTAKGVKLAYLTLHVGLGTFRPVKVDVITEHKMHSEHFELSQQTADLINQTKADGKRVIAVGTTSTRTVESIYQREGKIVACSGYTDIFIYPSYKFGVLDGLITNFHLPESTLIMLVSAFAGYDLTMTAYHTAIKENYRFFSFGDSMIIL